MSNYIVLPDITNGYRGYFATLADFPASDALGAVALNLADGKLYYWNGSAWAEASGGGGVTDHGALTGLADDDHTQYALADGSRAFSGDVTINGGLTVAGTLTTVNSTNIDVADKNITVNKGGNDASSAGAGITVERTSTNGSFIFDAATTTKWKVGLLGSEVEIVGLSSAQSITNKTIAVSSNTISGTAFRTPVFGSGGTLTEISNGTSGHFLKSAGGSANPSYAAIAQADVTGLTTSDTPTFAAVTLTNGVTAQSAAGTYGSGFLLNTAETNNNTFSTTNVGATGAYGYATSVTLPAGGWLVFGVFGAAVNGAVLTYFMAGGLSDAADGSTLTANDIVKIPALISGDDTQFSLAPKVFESDGTKTVYLNTLFNYTSGTPQHRGRIMRIRIY